jgi:hypothetical protein
MYVYRAAYIIHTLYINKKTPQIRNKEHIKHHSNMRGKHGSKFAAPRGKDISSMKKPEKESESKIHLKELKSRKRTNLAFIHLDRAEKLALDLLKICGDTTEKFAELTQIDEGVRTSTGLLVVEKQEQIQQNGKEFREKIEEIHNLIVPHVKLVKNYVKDVEHSGTSYNAASTQSLDTEEATTTLKSGPERSMYGSRLELRLASERHALLQKMLAIEKMKMMEMIPETETAVGEDEEEEGSDPHASNNSKKRKR